MSWRQFSHCLATFCFLLIFDLLLFVVDRRLAPISHPIELFEIWFQKNTSTVLIYWWNVSCLKLSFLCCWSGISIFINRCSDDDRPVGNSHGQSLFSGLEYQSSLFVTLVVIVRTEIPVTVLVRNIDCRYSLLQWWSSLMEISMPVVSVIYLFHTLLFIDWYWTFVKYLIDDHDADTLVTNGWWKFNCCCFVCRFCRCQFLKLLL
ncbi:hypothetical protein DERF_008167 [Dermatophagoides farinae]|uniref:Uncharacterized protein n=1 Tax=Dermatophagoides farinae TaxID=6954 RepID=A0A922HZE6_DERFA|nr:hypothetical protein DERF_008167 [Dermatophagoides farinae]